MDADQVNKLLVSLRRIEGWLSFLACLIVIVNLPQIIDFVSNHYKGVSFEIAMWSVFGVVALIVAVLFGYFRRKGRA
ncbi:MAG TPA: hypothetical protein VLY03_03545 [Bacteroidota bacterium]|nr:hypothetical protein [Bacteroidota bacterium]